MIAIATPAAILQILVTANAAQAITTLRTVDGKVQQSARHADKQASKIGSAVRKGMMVGAGGIAAGLALSVRAAADFESHFAEVRKTVDTNARGFAVLEKGIRRMAKTIPISANELSDLAGQAGALGIREKDLLRFTRTAAELGIATDLSSSDAANALARLANIMGTAGRDFRRLGSTFVRLGNEGASTEEEIASMALRIAGAGHQIGMSEAQVMAYASALSSVGINAEAGGSSISKVFVEIAQAVRAGKGKLDVLATTAGMSAGAYAKAFRQDASMATLKFIEGLDRMRRSGGDVFGTLEKLKFGEIRVRDALLRASGAGKLFREQLKTGNDEWRRNTALTREAAQRYATASARLQVLKNRVTDWGISIGQRLLPHLTAMMDILSDDRLTSEEKFDRLARMIGPLLSRGVEEGVRIVAAAGPKFVAALGTGIVSAWTGMSPLAKLFTAGAILTAVGGRGALLKTGAVLGRVLGMGVSGGMASSVATGGASSAAAGGAAGFMAGTKGKLIGLARGGALLGVGAVMADSILSELGRQSQKTDPALLTSLKAQTGPRGLPGKAFGAVDKIPGISGFSDEQKAAQKLLPIMQQVLSGRRQISQATIAEIQKLSQSLDLTKQQRAQYERILATLRQGSNLRIRVDAGMDPSALRKIRNNFDFLRTGVGASMADILKVSRRNMRLIADTMGINTAEGRKLAAQNMKAAANAINVQMMRSGDFTKSGLDRMKALIRNANLIDPSRKMAAQFGRGWAQGMDSAKEITRSGLARMIAEARKMPGPMRKVALETWLAQLNAARQNRRITEKEFQDLRSRVAAEFTGMRTASREAAKVVPLNVAQLTNQTSDGLLLLGQNTNSILGAFGARKLAFSVRRVRTQNRQTGGMIVPGTGTGDRVPAMLEPGEGIINRKAVAAMGGASAIHAINAKIPRFGRPERHQKGGIAGAVSAINRFEEAAFPYLWGGGHGATPAPWGPVDCSGFVSYVLQHAGINIPTMVSGDLANAGMPGPGPITVYANPTHTLMSVMGRFAGTSGQNPGGGAGWISRPDGGYLSGFTVRHFEAIAMELEKLAMAGAPGPLREMGQAALDLSRKAGNAKIKALAATFGGGGDAGDPGPIGRGGKVSAGGSYNKPALMDIWGQAGGVSSSANIAAAVALAESSGNPNASNNNTNGTIDRGLWQINSIHGALSTFDPLGNARAAVSISGNGSSWMPWVAYTNGNYAQYLQQGGIAQMLQRGGVAGFDTVGKGGAAALLGKRARVPLDILGNIDKTIATYRRPVPVRQQRKQLAKTLKLIEDVGLSDGRQRQLNALSQRADLAAEYAQRAASLSYEMTYAERAPMLGPDGRQMMDGREPMWFEPGDAVLDAENRPMTFFAEVAGKNEAGWTNERLATLMDLRNKLIEAEPIVRREQIKVANLLDEARKRLARIKREIADAAEVRKRVQREARQAENNIERFRKLLEDARDRFEKYRDRLEDLRKRPRRNAGRIADLLGRMGELRAKIGGYRNDITGETARMVGLRRESFDIGEQQKVRVNVRGAIEKLIGDESSGLIGKQARLREFYPTLLGTGSDSFKGLQTVQGNVEGMLAFAPLSAVPPIGTLGGEVFDAQEILRQLAVKPQPINRTPSPADDGTTPDTGPGGSDSSDSERIALLEQLLRESQQRTFVALRQFDVLRNFPAVGSLPFGGVFHTGGIVPGPRGQERMAVVKSREGVFTEEQMAAMGGGAGLGDLKVIVNGDIVSDARNPIEVEYGGQRFAVAVERVVNGMASRSVRSNGRAGAI